MQVVETAQRLGALCVRGNHDDAALAAYKQYQCSNPTPKTLKKYNYLQQYPKGFAEYLSSLPFSLQIPSYGIVVVHAGLVPGVSLLDQSLNDLYRMRDLRRDPNSGRQVITLTLIDCACIMSLLSLLLFSLLVILRMRSLAGK